MSENAHATLGTFILFLAAKRRKVFFSKTSIIFAYEGTGPTIKITNQTFFSDFSSRLKWCINFSFHAFQFGRCVFDSKCHPHTQNFLVISFELCAQVFKFCFFVFFFSFHLSLFPCGDRKRIAWGFFFFELFGHHRNLKADVIPTISLSSGKRKHKRRFQKPKHGIVLKPWTFWVDRGSIPIPALEATRQRASVHLYLTALTMASNSSSLSCF